MFKNNSEGWKAARKLAKIKEKKYINRCHSYLNLNKQVLEDSKNVAKDGIKRECKVTVDDFLMYEKIEDKEKKAAFLDCMDKRAR